ncbi:MAG: response regulator [Pseudoalteromonas sp.]
MDNVKSVLIIDDDSDDVFLIEDRLCQMLPGECHFVSCSEKQEAIDFLKERTFDLCILDYRLAGYEGLEILDAVANAELATPIIMLTGQNDDEVAKRAIKGGAQDFVMKSSIDEDVFEKSVRYAVSRKELEFARAMSQRNAAENTAKDKFIAHLSHELRTPLTSILGYTSILLENDKTLPFQNELKVISNNGKHLLNLLNDVLDLSKIAADKFELREKPTNLQELLIEVNSLLTVSAIDKGLALAFHSQTKLPKSITLDDLRFKQVLVNIIGNAIKFTDAGGVSVHISLINVNAKHTLEFRVVDTGIGMAEQQIDCIFVPFKQIEDVYNRKAGGAGLGLSITAEIVKQMGGKLEVKSELGTGSIFTLSVPCKLLGDTLIEYDFDINYKREIETNLPKLTGRALVVDDVFEIRELAGYFVKKTGVKVEFASNGEQALLKVAQAQHNNTPFDVIFMDLHMPVLTGEETIQILRKEGNMVNVVAMTAALNKGLYNDLTQLGFDALIAKPIDKLEIWKVLEKTFSQTVAQNKGQALHKVQTKPLIHLVEDDMDSANIMQMMLEQLNYRVLHSSTAKQAIANANTKSGDTIALHLLDLGLPDLKGEAFISAFFDKQIAGKVSILSGSQPDSALLERFPIVDHLIKPVSKDMLREWLAKNCDPSDFAS